MKEKKIKDDKNIELKKNENNENIENIKENLAQDENIIKQHLKKDKKKSSKKNNIDSSTGKILAGFPLKIMNLAFVHFEVKKFIYMFTHFLYPLNILYILL